MTAPHTWDVAGETLDMTAGLLVGVLNVTPDSFSDGGMFDNPDVAVSHGLQMVDEGAAIVDVGGESTRPGAEPVDSETEMRRVMPVLTALVAEGVRVSIDTSKADVAREAVSAGAVIVNDVSGFSDERMIEVVADSSASAIVMHMKGDPRGMQDDPVYDDVVAEVARFLADRAAHLEAAGVGHGRIVIDPGFGFGKTVRHNLEIIGGLQQLAGLGYPVMLGTSRKSTLTTLIGDSSIAHRDVATAVTTGLGFERGARIFRVHDVAGSRDALRIAAAIVG